MLSFQDFPDVGTVMAQRIVVVFGSSMANDTNCSSSKLFIYESFSTHAILRIKTPSLRTRICENDTRQSV